LRSDSDRDDQFIGTRLLFGKYVILENNLQLFVKTFNPVLLKVLGRELKNVSPMLRGWCEWRWIGSTNIIMYESIVGADKV
jgi:hypothetical protein